MDMICTCGNEVTYIFKNDKDRFEIAPCEDCLVEAREESHSEGYGKGYEQCEDDKEENTGKGSEEGGTTK